MPRSRATACTCSQGLAIGSSERRIRATAVVARSAPISPIAAHPSPMSADRGFFGSRPFSRSSLLLEQQGGEAIDWKLP